MSVVTILINGKHIQIACNDGEEDRVKAAGKVLSNKIDLLRSGNPKITTEYLLVICALGLQDEISTLQSKLTRMGDTGEDEKVAETLSTIAGYLESLAQKIAR